MKTTTLFLSCISFSFFALSQAPAIEWQKSLGGSDMDFGHSIAQVSDGYIVAGTAKSTDGDVTGNHGLFDYWLTKLDISGNLQWQKCLGGTDADVPLSIKKTFDDGYIIAGHTFSNDGDVNGNHGGIDYWIVKIDDIGNIQWQKCLGGTSEEYANCVTQTYNGGYAIAGTALSNDGDVTGGLGNRDFWIVQLDSLGTLEWQKCYGGSDEDDALSIIQTSDGGYIVAGNTSSIDVDVYGNHGLDDYWIIKLDEVGNLQWQKCLGGTQTDQATSIQETSDGGYIVAGRTSSDDGDVSGYHGAGDCWVVKLDNQANLQWQKCLGGTGYEDFTYPSIHETFDGGFIISNTTGSNDGDVSGNHGGSDYWIVKLNFNGILQWQKCLGGTLADYSRSIQQTIDGGYIVAGYSESNDGDVSGNHGDYDYWVVKLLPDGETSVFESTSNDALIISVHPNPATESIAIKSEQEFTSLYITNFLGEEVFNQNFLPKKEMEVTLSELAVGVYLLQAETDGLVRVKKFIKE